MISRAWYLVGVLTLITSAVWLHLSNQIGKKDSKIAELRDDIKTLTADRYKIAPQPFRTVGDQGPVPFRPHHPKRLGGKYYRGNDERHTELFNGGVYQTAMFRVFLCDQQKKELAWGSTVQGKDLLLGVEINRSNKAHLGLFDPRIMKTVFLSRMISKAKNQPVKSDFSFFNETKIDEQWVAYYPLTLDSDNTIRGMVYMYIGRANPEQFKAIYHYGIRYDLSTTNGQITDDSEIWMGSLYHPIKIQFPEKNKLPLTEWFDFRPIPEIVSENTTDPTLLGVDEHDGSENKNKTRKQDK